MKKSSLVSLACAFAVASLLADVEQEFDAAVRAGQPLTAEAAYVKLAKSGAQTTPLRHFLAADVARSLGKPTMRRDRLMLYLRQEKGWNAQVEQALWHLVSTGSGIEYYARLSANSKGSETLWRAGYGMLCQLDSANRPGEVIRLGDILMAKFDDPKRREAVLQILLQNAARWPENSTYPGRDLCDVIMKYPGFGNYEGFYSFLNWGSQRKHFAPDFMIRYAGKHGCDVKDYYLNMQMSPLDSESFAKLTDAEKIRERDERVAAIRAIRKLCFDGNHPEAARTYFNIAVLRLPKLFFRQVGTNGYVAGACDMYGELRAQKPYGESGAYRNNVIWSRNDAINRQRFSRQEIARLVEADPDSFDVNQLIAWGPLGNVGEASAKEQNAAPVTQLARKFPSRADAIYRACYERYVNDRKGEGDVGMVKRIFADCAKADRNLSGYHLIDWTVNGAKSMSVADKVAMFKSAYLVTGYNNVWKEFKSRVGREKNAKAFYADAAAKAFAATIREGDLPGDPIHLLSVRISRAKNVGDLQALANDLKKVCPSKFGEAKTARENDLVSYFLDRYRDLAWKANDKGVSRKYADFALERMSRKGPDRGWIWNHVDRAKDPALTLNYYRQCAVVEGTHDAYSGYVFPKDSEKPADGVDFKKMKPENAYAYLDRNWRNLKPSAQVGFFCDYLASQQLEKLSPGQVDGILGIADSLSFAKERNNEDFLGRFPLDKFESILFAEPYRCFDIPDSFWRFLRLACRKGRADEAIRRYCAWADKLEPRDRLRQYLNFLPQDILMPPGPGGKGSYWTKVVDFTNATKIVKGQMLAAIDAMPLTQAGSFDFNSHAFWDRLRELENAYVNEKTKDEAAAKAVRDWKRKFTALVLSGARTSEDVCYESRAWHQELNEALKAKDAVRAARVARKAGASAHPGWLGQDYIRDTMKALDESDLGEVHYLYVDAVPANQDQWLVAEAAKARAKLASSLPGIYPVGESDPSYPLYVAADELSKKNPERAWQILQDPRNQTVFEREALKLPPDFVIWGVEQLRMSRGDRDRLLLKARQIATAILAQEGKVAPEVVAAMILSRAEGYRDQQNFEAAKLEYQSIRDNPTYHATKYGKKAMFRAIDLQIATGNAQGVEATLEYWLSQNDREIQAEAHYFFAKLAFDRKDYDECIKQLRQVFAIDYTHTEGRFLQGEWKLATNSEVDDTEVLVGRLGNRNMIKPGNQFTITVQDANLSVAGGGASIPVIVRTKPGNDEERINLYPSSRDPSNFKGLVEVNLGRANPSNRVLEVRGNDVVTYVIDPAFLKERGLPLNAPKSLSVIDDAKVAMGAGAPRTDEKKTEKGIRELLEDDRAIDTGVTQKLRPGNPLYVVVRDCDRSLGGGSDTVRVTVETTSGDRLEDYELVEEKPFTGVFRGKIETSLPPPRAFASDTAAGLEAGDVINAGKKGGWKSLSDGQPGKWFEVDTMGSHLFSEIALDTPSVADIKSIKLVGRMGKRDFALGQLPAATAMSKLYLRRQQQYQAQPLRDLPKLRAFCQTDKAAKTYIVEKIAFRVLQNHTRTEWQTAFYQGPFEVPEGVDSFRLRVVQKAGRKDALRNLSLALAIDGEEVFSAQGCKLQDMLIAPDVTAGCHQFELAVAAASKDDEFDLLWEPIGKGVQPFPSDWFNEEKHAALKDFVKDRAQIVKTENGFKAVFDKPVRLRSFRWAFADVKSPDIAATRITAKNDRGETILPVATDFSDARNNKTLEVAPGDRITLRYEDERTTSGEKKVLQRQMASSFNDAKIRFIFEDTDDRGQVRANDAFRFQPGDALVLAVTDPDCDTTDGADKVSVTVRSRTGETFEKKLVEYWPKWFHDAESQSYGMHSGIFMGVIRTCPESNTNAPAKVLRVKADDLLTVTYEDRENTDPGVPCARETKIFAARPSEPVLTLFNVRKTQEIDRSADAKVKLERIRRRPGNENVQVVYRDVLTADPMDRSVLAATNEIPVNVSAGAIPARVNDRARARHAGSRIMIEAVAHSEIAKAAAEGRDPEKITLPLSLGGSLAPFRVQRGAESLKEAQAAGSFNGIIRLSLGPIDPNVEVPENAPPVLCVTGSDRVDVTVLDAEGRPVVKRTLALVSDGTLGLTDSSFSAERNSAHVGESFFVMVDDADRDATEEPDRIEATVVSSQSGVSRKMILTETMPHSGVFTGRLRPVMFAPGETIPSVATGGVATANETLTEERFSVRYGDKVIFTYRDELTLPWTSARTLATTGTVFRGANGNVRLFSKRFTDRDTAVLVQFRLAECLFEQAKEHRKLKQPAKSAAAIAEGKFILEEALKNYPDSSHVVQGEYLLANLYQELATEQQEAGETEKAIPLYQEALSRFSQILGTWPEGEYAARSQYHKALCLEMLKDYARASEEYVKMTYLYPESELVGEATIRLATYYYTKEKRYDISGHIYRNFQQRFPQHEKAPRALFMAGSCYIKQAETLSEEIEKRREAQQAVPREFETRIADCYKDAVKTFDALVETYHDSAAKLRAQALYWAGDVCVRRHDYAKAYQYLKRTVFEFPETEWARRARGLLLQEGDAFKDFE